MHVSPLDYSGFPRTPSSTRPLDDQDEPDDALSSSVQSSPPNSHRSRSLTLPPKSPAIRRTRHDGIAGSHRGSFGNDLRSAGSAAELQEEEEISPRLISHPVQIPTGSRAHQPGTGRTYPLTDGALAEFASLATTPQFNSTYLM